ncbi:cytochrome P450 [Artomyces pyxidatus]|uniref:Cytochrome P450 n=1 Tax=Artomyces pyxidatus TaxID=48021 RepID=A0ACB8SPH0_9AGAM|nr:cytochrome P450 [Artomyces pyxidatus]
MPFLILYVGLSCILFIVVWRAITVKSRLPLPPGPPQEFIYGNWHQMPISHSWRTYAAWAQKCGPLVYLRVFTHHMIVLNTASSATELLDMRSATYSDRPYSTMKYEIASRALSVFTITSSHPRFRRYRRILHTGLSQAATQSYNALLEDEVRTLARGLRDSPSDLVKHVRRNAGAVIMKLTYGWTVKEVDDYFVRLMKEGFEMSRQVSTPGRWLVDVFPVLQYVPAWFPGAGFQRIGKALGEGMNRTERIPFEWTKSQMASEKFTESFTSRHLRPSDGHTVDAEEEDIIKWCSAALYAGGADTTVSALTSFFYAMTLNPDIQARAQEEVDAHMETEHCLPRISDLPYLPYVQALVKEVLRWAPVAPLGLPHRVIEDDVYMGYRIPKGTIMVPNIWLVPNIMRDPDCYPDPFKFDPGRFITDSGKDVVQPDPRKFAFGFGRRICPGAHFAEVSLQISIATILRLYSVSRPRDSNGQEVEMDVGWTSGVTSHVENLTCDIRLRSPELGELLNEE